MAFLKHSSTIVIVKMEVGLHSAFTAIRVSCSLPVNHIKTHRKPQFLSSFTHNFTIFHHSQPKPSKFSKIFTASVTSNDVPSTFTAPCTSSENLPWVVIMDKPPPNTLLSKPQIINYYVTTLQSALHSDEKNAQRCIYDASCDRINYGFCCFVDKQTSHVLAGMPGVLSVKPDPDMSSVEKDYSYSFNQEENYVLLSTELLFPEGPKHWLVSVEKPSGRVFSKAQMVDFYVDILTKVLGNEKDAQMCLYHISWQQSNYGFCCMLDEECAQELAAVPGVMSVQPDENFKSENKNYGGDRLSSDDPTSANTSKTKLFVTGLSFYTSEKTLRAAFEPFGELAEVKVIMDKISRRSKGYAFIEYTTEDATTKALQEMNGKIISGWMIVVDRARSKPQLGRGP